MVNKVLSCPPCIEPDEVQVYDEVAACNGSYGVLKEDEFIKEFMK